jgi:hypothetical protein
LAEREARRRRAEASSGVAPKTIKSSNSLTRLAAAAGEPVAKPAASRDSVTRGSSASEVAPSAGSGAPAGGNSRSRPAGGNAPAPMAKQASGGNNELMAAMAKRRAKQQE